MVAGILDAVLIQILPPPPAEVAGLAGTEFSLPGAQELESALYRKRVFYHEGVVVQLLTRDVYHAGSSVTESRQGVARSRGG